MALTAKHNTQSCTQTENTDLSFKCYKAVKEAKIDAKESQQIAVSLYDSLNNVCRSLEKLDSIMESLIFNKIKENGK